MFLKCLRASVRKSRLAIFIKALNRQDFLAFLRMSLLLLLRLKELFAELIAARNNFLLLWNFKQIIFDNAFFKMICVLVF